MSRLTRALLIVPMAVSMAAGCTVRSHAGEAAVESVTFESRGVRLAGTLHLPKRERRVPAVVLVHGSGRMTASDMYGNAQQLVQMGLAVLAYDKRGAGGSGGEYSGVGPANSESMFDLLAADALAGADLLRARPEIDSARIGLLGISQGGWIAPLAAAERAGALKRAGRASGSAADIAFVAVFSGPAVTVGEEIAYSRLAGADPGSRQGLSEAEIEREYRAFTGPHGYDPAPALRAMTAPSLWILGDRDRSLPVAHTVENLERAKAAGAPITIRLMPGLDHSLRGPNGYTHAHWQALGDWLREYRITQPSERAR